MSKQIRKAVRCLLIKDNKTVAIKYTKGRIGYYDIPGGKIEDLEHPLETVKREFKEESGLLVDDLVYRGKVILEYEDRIYDLAIFIATKYSGRLKSDDTSVASWMDIQELTNQHQKFAWMTILGSEFIDNLFKYDKLLDVKMEADNTDHIISMNYNLKEYSYREVKKYLPTENGIIKRVQQYFNDDSESL